MKFTNYGENKKITENNESNENNENNEKNSS